MERCQELAGRLAKVYSLPRPYHFLKLSTPKRRILINLKVQGSLVSAATPLGLPLDMGNCNRCLGVWLKNPSYHYWPKPARKQKFEPETSE
jgi:hypothetical protein